MIQGAVLEQVLQQGYRQPPSIDWGGGYHPGPMFPPGGFPGDGPDIFGDSGGYGGGGGFDGGGSGDAFDTGEAGEEVETLGGFIVTHVGRLPVRGEIISGPGDFEIEVLDADPRRVKRLRIGPRKERPAPRTREQRRRDAAPDAAPSSGERPASPSSG